MTRKNAAEDWVARWVENPAGDSISGLGTLLCTDIGPDGKRLATGGSGGVVVWDIGERRVIRRFAHDIAPICEVAFSNDGNQIAAIGAGGVIVFYDWLKGAISQTLEWPDEDEPLERGENAVSLRFSPDGLSALLMTEASAWLLSGKRALRLTGEGGKLGEEATVVGFSSAGEIVAIEGDGISFYRTSGEGKKAKFEVSRTLDLHVGTKWTVVSGDGRFLLASDPGTKENSYLIASLETGDVLATPRFREDVFGVRFARRAPLVFLDVYNAPTIVAFPERKGETPRELRNNGHVARVGVSASFSLSPDGDFYVSSESYYGEISFFNLEGKEIGERLGRYIYDCDSGVTIAGLDEKAEHCVVIGFIGDGQNSSAWAQSWSLVEDKPGPTFEDGGLALFCTSAPAIPGTNLVALPLDTSGIALFDTKTGKMTILEHHDAFQNVAVSKDGSMVAGGGANGFIALWDSQTGAELASFVAHKEQICGIGWQPGGDVIATSSQDGSVRFWSVKAMIAEGEDVEPLATAKKIGDMLYHVVFSADGSLCAVGTSDGKACIIRVSDGHVIAQYKGHGSEVMALAFHPRTNHLVAASMSGTIKVWDVETNKEAGSLSYEAESEGEEGEGQFAGITALAFDEAGTALLVCHGSGLIRRWNLG